MPRNIGMAGDDGWGVVRIISWSRDWQSRGMERVENACGHGRLGQKQSADPVGEDVLIECRSHNSCPTKLSYSTIDLVFLILSHAEVRVSCAIGFWLGI